MTSIRWYVKILFMQKKENVLISIVIPTYKRPKFLETEIECIAKQVIEGKFEDIIEVVIADDASGDETGAYLQEINKKYSFVWGFTQPKNLGVAKNINSLMELAKGKYAIISGDDDLFTDGALKYIVKKINEFNPNFILINTSNIISLDDSNKKYKITEPNRLGYEKDIFVENFQRDEKLLDKCTNWLYLTNLLPVLIFRKDIWYEFMPISEKYLRPENVYLYWPPTLVGISKYGRLLVIGECYILHRKNETNYTKNISLDFYIDTVDSTQVGKIVKIYMPTQYKKYMRHFAALLMGRLLLRTSTGINVRKYAWSAFLHYMNLFPENIQFLSMTIAPKLINKTSHRLRAYKNYFLQTK